ncbi:hypothetical protein [Nonomuraea turcica]|uniref:hypothetical protein n=1 Tax=Nonomuraea sp. G32 TaxID=3067274 RepID=UPI00273BE815|nr:hypothetical protein [Nonomuraea sp. G32]MDP4511619.1 hypothetical protein [Nonomuraea sp. G32]
MHLLLRPFVEHIEALPPQQAEALHGALGLGGASRGDRFLVGLATLFVSPPLPEPSAHITAEHAPAS